MSAPAASASASRRLEVGVLAALALSCCAATHLACGAPLGEHPESAPSSVGADAAAQAGADGGGDSPACRVRRAERTFVGFSDGMSLEDFELAAFEAERILLAVKAQLCELDAALDADGSLRAALDDGAIELTSIVFTQDDAGAADVHARWLPDASAPAAFEDPAIPSWSLRLTRMDDGWRVVAVVPAGRDVRAHTSWPSTWRCPRLRAPARRAADSWRTLASLRMLHSRLSPRDQLI